MNPERSLLAVERRDRGLALGDDLIESSRVLAPLPEVVHAKVKRRLKASLRRSALHRPRWLQPLLIGSVMLICGAAFGIALDRLVLQRSSVSPEKPRSHAPKGKPHSSRASAKAAAPAAGGTADDERIAVVEPARDQDVPVAQPTSVAASPVPTVPSPIRVASSRVESRGPARGANGLPKLAMRWESARAGHTPAPATELPALTTAPAPVIPAPPLAPSETTAPAEVTPAKVERQTEERLLSAAVRALRAQRDPSSALLALDEYRARFPRGRLIVEADVLRVDTLVSLQRNAEALATLEHMVLGHMPGGLERQLQRGELRAAVGRWQDARSDFDQVLAHARGHSHELSERALWGRAQSRVHLGDERGARADAEAYLRRFPKGRFAAQAERLAGAGRPSAR